MLAGLENARFHPHLSPQNNGFLAEELMMPTHSTTHSKRFPSGERGRALFAALLATTFLATPLLMHSPANALANDATTPAAVSASTPFAGSFADIVERTRPAVVSVLVKQTVAAAGEAGEDGQQQLPEGLDKFFKQFGMPEGFGKKFRMPQQPQGEGERVEGQGSGFFISADGYLVTNNHVVESADKIEVQMSDGKKLPAKLIGTDAKTDLAVIKVEGGNFTHVAFGDSDKSRVGDWVVAMGNPFGLGGTATAGIVSARGRDIGSGPYDDFIQIDAPINKGNSGGPTFNTSGEVIGVNTAILSPSGGSVGIGFAIPSNEAKTIVATLMKEGSIARGWLGIAIQPVSDDMAESLGYKGTDGALVASVNDGSPAEKAGLQPGDVVVSVDGAHIRTPRELSVTIAQKGPKAHVDLGLWRQGRELQKPVDLAAMPSEQKVASAAPDEPARSKLGLTLEDGDKGVTVSAVKPGSPAADAELAPGDVIRQVAGKDVASTKELFDQLASLAKAGKTRVMILVEGANGAHFTVLKVGKAVG
jgi:serine protease Do